ncbi:MAG: MarR family transcriptional regulator [Methylotenera sp.]|nr:MarR family transcriptional regulator [Flavobacterium sp.]
MYTQDDKDNFFNAIESLKKYRRADLLDEKGKNLLEALYTDLLPNDHILKKSIRENTTFLIGRKGTGKSTIFLRIEQELRKKDNFLPCYLDVKTIYDAAHSEFLNLDYLAEYLPPKTIKKYLIERSFLQSVLKKIIEEIDLRYNTFYEKLKQLFGETKAQETKAKIEKLKKLIEDNEALKEIEIPIIKSITSKKKTFQENKTLKTDTTKDSLGTGVSSAGPKAGLDLSDESSESNGTLTSTELEEGFSGIFLQVFQIKTFIEDIKEILKSVNIRHIVVLLDDFSEIEDYALKTFVDVILAPLNNWSDEFIKFKIAAYPNRIYYGKIDPGKVDTINLDFYNLYSEFDRSKMEEGAIDFTKRIIEKRFQHFVKKPASEFFDTSKLSMDDYYKLIFQTSMNVPRIIGYLLSFCYESKIIYNKPITKQDIEAAAQRYYEDKIEPFFHKTTFSLLSLNEKIDTLQLKELLQKFVERMTETKRKITSGEYSGEAYLPTFPFCSHFHFNSSLETFLKTLELNFFISKYTEMSDKDGQLSSIYSLNYGLTQKHNLLWGKPEGTKHRKYFIERPYNYNGLLKDFLASSKSIHCINEECNQVFNQEQLPLLEYSGFKCNKCHSDVIIEAISNDIKTELIKIEQDNLLRPTDIDIVMELTKQTEPITAREISEELDISSYSIAHKNKMLDLKKGLIKRDQTKSPYTYELTEKAKNLYK